MVEPADPGPRLELAIDILRAAGWTEAQLAQFDPFDPESMSAFFSALAAATESILQGEP
jgi:hypothetical protein